MSDRVAVVGMSIRAANVRNTADYWRLISTGSSGRREIGHEELALRGVSDRRYKDPAYVPVTYPMEDCLGFDVKAFGVSRSEAEYTDPQHRVMLEACYRAVESSGCFIGSLPDRVGVFLGLRTSDYGAQIERHASAESDLDLARLAIGTNPDYISSRISYAYGLTGPSMTVLTDCSSSSVAVHLACQAILAGECDSVLAGGVAVNVRDAGYMFAEGGIYSPRGRCEPYMASADGTVDGNGAAVLFLRRLDVALAAGNPILGVVAGTAVNNDGRERAGFAAPGFAGQVELIEEALDVAELRSSRIGLLEGHGAGTSIGDALEIDAATQAFRSSGAGADKCRLHSVKANIGNLSAAAGAAGIIGCLLALRHGKIPPNAPLVEGALPADLRGTPFVLADKPIAWPRSDHGRYAAVSSFGLGGTNAHVIIADAEPEVRIASRKGRSWQLLPLSADDPERLTAAVEAVRVATDGASAGVRRDIGHTLRTGRPMLTARATALIPVDGSAHDVRWPDPDRFRTAHEGPPALVFMLPGEDFKASDAAVALYEAEQVFRSTVDDGLAVMEQMLVPETFAAVRGAFLHGGLPIAAQILQPVLHLLGVGQHAFLGDLGIRPDLLMGQGVGELTAAQLSGVLSFEDAARAVCWRGQAMADMSPGSIPMVHAGLDELADLPGGAEAAVRFTRRIRDFRLHAPTTPTISCVTGSWLTGEEARDPGYWGAQLREHVLIDEAVRTVVSEYPQAVYLQLSGGTNLLRAAPLGGVAADAALAVLPDGEATESWSLLQTIGGLWERGVQINWDVYAERDHALRIDIAPRSFARTPYLHPALLDHCPGIDPAELAGEQAG
ncbi:MAG: beta-ketoacyl synthase N-terminal-like domain-containing protein [Actinomycetota bacterium]